MRTLIRKILISALLTISVSAHAAEWKIDPSLRFKAGYNDNLLMSINDRAASPETTFTPSAIFSVASPSSGLSGDLRFYFRRFENNSSLDDNNARINISSYRSLEQTRLGLDLGFVKDTTLDSQLEETGLTFGRIPRQRVTISPNWAHSFNSRTRVSANYSYSDVEYKNTSKTRFANYSLNSAQASLSHVLNERTTATMTLSVSQSINDNNSESITTNLQGGSSYQFSEGLSASLFAGIRRTETNYSRNTPQLILVNDIFVGVFYLPEDVSSNSSGYTFNASLEKMFLRGKSTITTSRNISNSTYGLPIEVTRLTWKNLYRLSETLSVNLDLDLYNSKSENSVSRRLNRDYYQINSKIDWKFRKFWRISGSYRYREQTYSGTSDNATQNAAYLTLTYQWPRIAVSR